MPKALSIKNGNDLGAIQDEQVLIVSRAKQLYGVFNS